MRPPIRTSVAAVCVIVVALSSCFGCDASEIASRSKRGVVPGNAASRPKDMCRSDTFCKQWPKTSCAKDPVDGIQRCLCADQSHPINKDCITTPQGLGMQCELDVQCIQLAYCALNASDPATEMKICQCRDEFKEEDGTCSGQLN
ncbi:Hypothetical protein CINCED_3A017208 [Cinara cedri]|uniref:EB domain-containing protein n=1 Tax=Cinara cedri TaxID=506608 RepID=A0A5E4ND25_9HEMI|nr:Hypothetical protein CINCED_3A017208 [Cinara cedri]